MSKYNPFNPNSTVAPQLFAGRSRQINEICKKLSQLKHDMPASFFLFGERGIGKTALVKLIRYLSRDNDKDFHSLNLLTSYYSTEAGQDLSSILEESVNRLTEDMDKSLVSKIGERVGNIFKNGKFRIGAFGTSFDFEANQDELKRAITIKDQTVSILINILKSLSAKEDAQEKREGILIIIDEIHNLKNLSEAASIIRNITTTLDVENLGKVSFLLVGYEEDVEKFFSSDPSARRTFDLIKLETMPNEEAEEVLIKGFNAAGINYDHQALKNIFIAGGYPHSIQTIAHELIEIDQDDYLDEKDWDSAAVKTAILLKAKEFADMYSFGKKSTVKDEILILLAEKNEPLSKKEIAQAIKKNVYQYFPALKKLGAIKENEKEEIYLQSQLFRTAILIDNYIRNI